MDISIEGAPDMLGLEQGQIQQQLPPPTDQRNHATPINGFHGSTESFPDLAIQQDLYDQQQQQQQLHMQNQRYHGQNVVPPTPNSLEMHGGQAQYYRTPADHQQLHMYDHYRRAQRDQVGTSAPRPSVTAVLICLIDDFYASGVSCRDSTRFAIPVPRLCCAYRGLQSVNLACSESAKSSDPTLCLWSSPKLRYLRYNVPHRPKSGAIRTYHWSTSSDFAQVQTENVFVIYKESSPCCKTISRNEATKQEEAAV